MKSIWQVQLIFYILIAHLSITEAHVSDRLTIESPNKKIVFTLLIENGKPYFSIKANKHFIIEPSSLNLQMDNMALTEGVHIVASDPYSIDETYPWYSVLNTIKNQAKGLKVTLENKQLNQLLTIDIRVADDAASYRFMVDGKKMQKRIPDENSTFVIPKGTYLWHHDLRMHYESVYDKSLIDTLRRNVWIAPVATLKLQNGYYAAITEADLKNYSGMALQSNGQRTLQLKLAHHQPTSYPYELRYSKEDVQRLSQPAVITGTIMSPWRVVIIAKNLNDLVNNNVVYNLNPPPDKKLFPKGMEAEWIKPGIAVWKYLDGGGESTLSTMKNFSEQAGKLGFNYNILEGFWSKWTDEEISTLVNYSKKFNVRLFVWVHSKNIRNPEDRHKLFERCHRLGIAGLKIDFFDHEAKEVIDLYQDILAETASYKLLLDFHGANKPTGGSRTWPHELTREAVKGMEASKLEDRATHQVTLPFTRFIIGPAEYTPLLFGERKKNTTLANQVASAAILSAPLLTYAASPQHILDNPAVDVLKNIPSTWDETIVLEPSEIGKIAVFARRKNDQWFIAVMNGTEPQKIAIPLYFLKKDTYQAILYTDASIDRLKKEKRNVNKTDKLSVELKPGGGFIAQLSKH